MQAFMADVEASVKSEHQVEVSQVLSNMGIKHAMNYLTSDGLFCVDILIQGYHVIIQVDEVHHWTTNTGQPIGTYACLHIGCYSEVQVQGGGTSILAACSAANSIAYIVGPCYCSVS